MLGDQDRQPPQKNQDKARTGLFLARIIHDPTVARRLQVLSPQCFTTERTAAGLALLVNNGR